MAGAEHNPSRRAVLGAAVALPLVGAGGAGEAPGPLHRPPRAGEDWGAALSAYEAAAGELGRFEAYCRGRPDEEQMALDHGYDARSDRMYDALRRLLKAPAPDIAALAAKLDLVVAHEVGTLTGGEACLAAICRDAHRLSLSN